MSSSPLTATNFLIAVVVMRLFVNAIMSRRRLGHSIPIQEEEDRISALPDSLLRHILSFLPTTKDAAVTSLLSKRWKPLWLSQLTLNFDENHFPNALTFRNFVYSILGRRDKTLPILQFNLKSHKYSCVSTLIRVAIDRGIQNLSLDMNMSNLPPFVLSCETLTVLNLKSVVIYSDPPVDLPSLKVLHMESVTLQNHQYLWKIFCGCPILEEFKTKHLQIFKTPPPIQKLFQVVRQEEKFCKPHWEDPDIVPECLLSRLTKCSLKIDSHLSWEFQFAKYIMQNSVVLNNMTIQSNKNLDTDVKDQMFMELSLCARNPTMCQLLFI